MTSTWISYLLVLGGAFLLYLGARDFLGSRTGQQEAARVFSQTPVAHHPEPASVRAARTPKRGEPLAKLVIPRLDTELYVVEGDGSPELRRGPGHMSGTAMPGAAGNCVIAGHRDTHFRVLKHIRPGDDIFLETRAAIYIYRVSKTSIVTPDDTRSLQPTPDAHLNLITCYPFTYVGSAPKRFVVEARLTGSTPPAS